MEKENLLDELDKLCNELKSYEKRIISEKSATDAQRRYTNSIRYRLVNKAGVYKPIIKELTGKQFQENNVTNKLYDIWDTALTPNPSISKLSALRLCIDATNEAMGIFEAKDKSAQKSFIKHLSIEGKDFIATVIAKVIDEKTK